MPNKPDLYPFVLRDYAREAEYESGFQIPELFELGSLGFQTHRDDFAIAATKSELLERLSAFSSGKPDFDIQQAYGLKDNRDWKISDARKRTSSIGDLNRLISTCLYRPFDVRPCILDVVAMDYPRGEINVHIDKNPNLSLCIPRQLAFSGYHHALVTDRPAESCAISTKTKEQNRIFLLYRYPVEAGQRDAFFATTRTLNLDPKPYASICKAAGIDPADQAGPDHDFRAAIGEARPSEVKVFDYIYAVLHAPAYRETFAEFLKIDFPRIPYPPSAQVFRHVSEKGEQLRRLHLMEAPAIGETPYPYHGEGDDVVASGFPKFEAGKVHINKDQYFEGVPEIAWSFHIGGYQPAQKWLKDRRGRSLSWDDIGHYQKIIKILIETDRVMREIELPLSDGSPDND